MAVVITNGDVGLSSVGGFDVAENYNLGMFSTTDLALSSTRTIGFTPATGRNSKGVILALSASAATVNRSVVVDLQENVAAVWTTRSTVTVTAADILASTDKASSNVIVFFDYADYAVTAAATTWRFQLSQTGGTTGNWQLRTSDGTNPFYVEVPDKSGSFSSNDTVVVKPGDTLTVDQTSTVKGTLGTGDSANGVALILGRCSNPPTSANSEASLSWDGSAARTLTIDGMIIGGAHSCIRIGTSASRISYANQGFMDFISRTVGTTASGIYNCEGANNAEDKKLSVFIYGEKPLVEDCELNADTTVSGTTFTTATDVSSWLNAWRIFVSKQNVSGVGDTALYVLDGAPSWSGSQSTLTTTVGLATNVRKSGGKIVLLDGRGFRIRGSTSNRPVFSFRGSSNLVFDGVQIEDITVTGNFSNTVSLDDSAYRGPFEFKNCAIYTSVSGTIFPGAAMPYSNSMTVDHCNFIRCNGVSIGQWPSTAGILTLSNCIVQSAIGGADCTSATNRCISTGNVFENTAVQTWGTSITYTGNKHWGAATLMTLAQRGATVNATFGSNSFNRGTTAIAINTQPVVNVADSDSSFGNEAANTTDISFSAAALTQVLLNSPTGSVVIDASNLPDTVVGSKLAITDYNDTANDDRNWLTNGLIVRTGDGLSDTTVRTAGSGKFAMRFQPTSGTDALQFSQNVPTGDIEDLTMSVSVWCYVNSTDYDAGTHSMPTLRVTYDNATNASAIATATFGSWQRLSVNFTPTTPFGQIEVTLEAATDAAGSNAYVYWDDFSINYPPGIAPSLAGMDLWADALPITPSIALVNADAGSVWDALLSSHSVSGSFGSKAKQDLTTGQFIALK